MKRHAWRTLKNQYKYQKSGNRARRKCEFYQNMRKWIIMDHLLRYLFSILACGFDGPWRPQNGAGFHLGPHNGAGMSGELQLYWTTNVPWNLHSYWNTTLIWNLKSYWTNTQLQKWESYNPDRELKVVLNWHSTSQAKKSTSVQSNKNLVWSSPLVRIQ